MACKAKELSAQGNALGIYASGMMRPTGAKALDIERLLPLWGAVYTQPHKPKAMPRADSFLPLWGVISPHQLKVCI